MWRIRLETREWLAMSSHGVIATCAVTMEHQAYYISSNLLGPSLLYYSTRG
jgi:hypothetical protein